MPIDSEVVGSASAGGRLIKVVDTGSPGTSLHLGVPVTGVTWDAITILAVNNDTVSRTLTIEWGATGADNEIKKQMRPQQGFELILDRCRLKRGGSFRVRAYADAANVVFCYVQIESLGF